MASPIYYRFNLQVGRLNRRIEIMELNRIPDGGGGFENVLTTKYTLWASITPLTGLEYWSEQQTEAQVTHKIYIRYREDITQSCVVKYKEKLYDIQYIQNIDEANRFMELHVLERRS